MLVNIVVVTGFEFGRAEGREKNSLDVLDWDIERIQSQFTSDDKSLSGLESLLRELHDLESELKFLQGVPGETPEERKAIQARRKKITQMIRKLKDKIEKTKYKIEEEKKDLTKRTSIEETWQGDGSTENFESTNQKS